MREPPRAEGHDPPLTVAPTSRADRQRGCPERRRLEFHRRAARPTWPRQTGPSLSRARDPSTRPAHTCPPRALHTPAGLDGLPSGAGRFASPVGRVIGHLMHRRRPSDPRESNRIHPPARILLPGFALGPAPRGRGPKRGPEAACFRITGRFGSAICSPSGKKYRNYAIQQDKVLRLPEYPVPTSERVQNTRRRLR